ncbi:MAG TPA: hypothetical protein VNL69_09295, partial [Bacteroidota bacterium]|nr:hypothetical protein [Bacteroidota bacterium]
MRIFLGFLFTAALSALLYVSASGWGGYTHQFINRSVVRHLPHQMLLFIQDSLFFAQHASDADNRRNSSDT